jgi:KDO2-lipid IV(A) lauroyltransferase
MVILYYIFVLKVWVLSKFPLSFLYGLSGMLRLLLQYVLKYRQKVILQNLSNAFPDKGHHEIRIIMKDYYRNLADIIMEVFKWRSITEKELIKRFRFENYHLFEEAFAREQSVIIAIGHCGNWEWMGTALGRISPKEGYAVVKPLSDKRFNRYMESLRHRLNPDSTIPFRETFRRLAKNKKEKQAFYVFAADQTPTRDEINYWSRFLNQDTGFFLGIEKIARALDFAVIFVDIVRESRGHYKGVMKLITAEPKSTEEFEITEAYIRELEHAIQENPDNWLWSHRRWKHKRSE